jgi:PAS domain-containing protein
MRASLRTQEALAVTLLTLAVVGTTTALHLGQLARVVVEEARAQADLVARQVAAQASRALARGGRRDAGEVLRRDRELRSLLDASVGYSPRLLYVLIADPAGRVLAHSEPAREGAPAPGVPGVQALLGMDPLRRLLTLYGSGQTYEAELAVSLGGQPFGSVRLGLSTSLLRRELGGAVRQSLALAGVALPVAWALAMVLAKLVLRPVRELARDVDRLRRGEFDLGRRPERRDEIGELAGQLQLLSEELAAGRGRAPAAAAPLEHVVDRLEDGVICLTPDRRVLPANRAAAGPLSLAPAAAAGRPLAEVLAEGHPLRGALEAALEDGAAARNVQVALPVDGRSREYLLSVFRLGEGPQALGFLVLLRDHRRRARCRRRGRRPPSWCLSCRPGRRAVSRARPRLASRAPSAWCGRSTRRDSPLPSRRSTPPSRASSPRPARP